MHEDLAFDTKWETYFSKKDKKPNKKRNNYEKFKMFLIKYK